MHKSRNGNVWLGSSIPEMHLEALVGQTPCEPTVPYSCQTKAQFLAVLTGM